MTKSLFTLFIFCVAIGIIIFPVYAFASTDSGPQASGEGIGTISGWVVSNVEYQSSNDPSLVGGVSFDLDKAAGNVSAKISSTSQYANCSNVYEYHWRCDFPAGISIASMDKLHVIATGN
ncbi:MAG: hypothetical protein IPP66_22325 [Anaerolineales bacterium]|nr:hypothetical protein [Anaerolineales bacterium]